MKALKNNNMTIHLNSKQQLEGGFIYGGRESQLYRWVWRGINTLETMSGQGVAENNSRKLHLSLCLVFLCGVCTFSLCTHGFSLITVYQEHVI